MWHSLGVIVLSLTLPVDGAADEKKKSASASEDDRPFVRLVPNLARDVISIPSRQSLLLLIAGTASAAALSTRDASAQQWAVRVGRSQATDVGSAAGEGWVQGTIALGTYVAGAVSGHRAITHIGSDFVRAQVLNGLVTGGLKVSVDRIRPNGGEFSFPSGHTSATFATAAVLHGHYGLKVGVPAYAFAAFVGWSRVREGKHWASDVAAGATLGTIVGLTVTSGHRERGWTVTPTPTAGGFAIVVTR